MFVPLTGLGKEDSPGQERGRERSAKTNRMIATADIDIWRAAKLLVDRHGAKAPMKAAKRADAMRNMGDLAGSAVWLSIKAACEDLLAERPKGAVY